MKKNIAQTTSVGNDYQQLPKLEPYNELMLRTLVAALRYLPLAWASGWVTLDRDGRRYLETEGLSRADLKQAINDGVRSGLIIRRLIGGCPAIALVRKAVKR